MSVSLVTYPVVTASGKVYNIFPGFSSVELQFKREDLAIVSISQGTDNRIVVTVSGDITSSLAIGEWFYLYAEGVSHIYEGVYQVYDISFSSPNTVIEIDDQYIQAATTGYINYKQNWYLEAKLVDKDNNLILKYPALLQNDGSPDGIVTINTSMLVDFLKNEILSASGELVNAREECKVMYREVWREDDTQSFTLVDEYPIVIIFSADETEIEDFINSFEFPRLYEGYDFFLNFLHSLENETGKRIQVTFDELDINKTNITTNNLLVDFNVDDFGILQANFEDNPNPIDDDTRYIVFNANTSSQADYETGDYNDNDYQTINTP